MFIPSDFPVLLTSPEAATRVILYKKLLLKISQYSRENTCVGVLCTKRRFQHRCFPVNIVKCLRTPVLKNNCEWLLLRLILRFHLRVPSQGPILGSHPNVPLQGPILGPHPRVPPQDHTLGSHFRVPLEGPGSKVPPQSPGSHFSGMPIK